MWNPEKKKVLDTAFNQIEKQFGKGAIMKMDDTSRPLVPVISSGNIALDVVLGTGGYPVGRIVEIFGPESSGKTTLALHGIAETQRAVVLQLLLMQNTLLILTMLKNSE